MPKYDLNAGMFPPVLDEYLWNRDRACFVMGPLGSGKTYASIVRLLQLMVEQEPNAEGVRPTRMVAVRNTYPDLMNTTVKDTLEIFKDGPMGQMKMGGTEPPNFQVAFGLPDGTRVKSEILFLALDRADAVKKVRGLQNTWTWLNEAKELEKPIVDMLDLRHGRYPSAAAGSVECTQHGMFGDTNAPDDSSWYYRLAEVDRPPDWKFLRQPGGLFPTGEKDLHGRELFTSNPDAENLTNLPDGYYTIGQQGKADDWIRVNLANEYGFLVDGKPVHPEYVDSVHCTADPIEYNPDLPIILGIDFGRTPAAAIVQFDPAWGRFLIIDEFVSDDMSQQLFAPELRLYLNTTYGVEFDQSKGPMRVQAWCDPAGEAKGQATEDTPRRILMAHGIPALPAPSNSPLLRRAALANPLRRLCADGAPALLISPRAAVLRKGLMGGFCFRRMKVSGSERFHEQPDKSVYSHVVEGAEYALLSEGEGSAALAAPWEADDASDDRQSHAIM